jgi:hypothetical protein
LILQFIGSVLLFLGMLQFFLALRVGDMYVLKLHALLAVIGGIVLAYGTVRKKRKSNPENVST